MPIRDFNTLKFIWFNYRKYKATKSSKSIVLLEYTKMQPTILATSLLVRVLTKKHIGSTFIAYTFRDNYKYYPHLKLIYKSFGVEIKRFQISNKHKISAQEKVSEIIDLNLDNDDLLTFKINDMMIGDLIYDHYLRHHKSPTLSLKDDSYKNTLQEGLEQYFFFEDYMQNNDVKAVHVSHQCYFQAIPLRVAVNKNIDVFACHNSDCQRFNKDRLWGWKECRDYRSIFNSLTEKHKARALQWSKSRIEKRFSGDVGVDMYYSKKSAFSEINRNIRVIKKSDKIKILIAAHCFFDAPNGFGLSLFPDFYIWLSKLGDMSNKTDYDWYIKTHPDLIPGNNEIVNEILSKYPRIKLLDQNTSHKQIVHDGIDFVLTTHGTVGFEYAAMGITVINASLTNPHIGYDFNIHPSSRKEYINLLLNLTDKVKIEISNNDIYEFYYMRHYYFNTSDWLLLNRDFYIKNSNKLMSSKIYGDYIDSTRNNKVEMNKRLNTFHEFVMGDDELMTHHGYRN